MLAIIGGSGFYDLSGTNTTRQSIKTPFGAPSAEITTLTADNGVQTLFLPRHGETHNLLPSGINYRANIWALKNAGARQIIAVSACGSLREEICPGDFIVPSQYFDHTKGGRARTFFGNGLVAHISAARPSCPLLTAAIVAAAHKNKFTVHEDKLYACVEGPRLGTKAESFFLRDAVAADIVGMTNIPEVFLALEAQISYATLAICTDYDCWQDDPAAHATVEKIIARFGESIQKARQMIATIMSNPPAVDDAKRCNTAAAILTPTTAHTEAHKELLEVLLT